jgi:hypothetical protein
MEERVGYVAIAEDPTLTEVSFSEIPNCCSLSIHQSFTRSEIDKLMSLRSTKWRRCSTEEVVAAFNFRHVEDRTFPHITLPPQSAITPILYPNRDCVPVQTCRMLENQQGSGLLRVPNVTQPRELSFLLLNRKLRACARVMHMLCRASMKRTEMLSIEIKCT